MQAILVMHQRMVWNTYCRAKEHKAEKCRKSRAAEQTCDGITLNVHNAKVITTNKKNLVMWNLISP